MHSQQPKRHGPFSVVLHPSHVLHLTQNHLLPLATSVVNCIDVLAPILAQVVCNDIPQPSHELSGSGEPFGPFIFVPEHSEQTASLGGEV